MTSDTEQPENNQPIPNPVFEQLRRDMQTPGPWARRFRALAEAIVNAGESKTTLTCHDVQDLLDVYVNDEMKGHEVRLAHPEVWQHLQTCTHCQHEHDVVLAVLNERDEETDPDFKPGLRPLSFLQPKGDRARWISRVRSRLAGASFGLHILLNPDFLGSKLGFGLPLQTANAYRSDTLDLSSGPRVLLIDTVPFDGQHVNVEISVARAADQPDGLTLQATLTGSTSLPANLWIGLTWAGQTHTAPVTHVRPDEGHVQVEGISLERVREALSAPEARFEIVFETRDTPADDDRAISPD
ncbi:MAG TPA: hypothetical protein VIK33_16325 [Anaerolineae bacterium]